MTVQESNYSTRKQLQDSYKTVTSRPLCQGSHVRSVSDPYSFYTDPDLDKMSLWIRMQLKISVQIQINALQNYQCCGAGAAKSRNFWSEPNYEVSAPTPGSWSDYISILNHTVIHITELAYCK
jgi:hypothetical protein